MSCIIWFLNTPGSIFDEILVFVVESKMTFLLVYAVTAKTVKKPNKTGVIPYLSAIRRQSAQLPLHE